MKKNLQYAVGFLSFAALATGIVSCEKDPVAQQVTPAAPVATASFVEQFDNVGELSAKGWVFKNNSNPIGQSGWRQGRYESANVAQYKFLAPVPFIGFPAYNATNTPNDFVSCDASAVNDALSGTGNISAWLISPSLPMRNGDKIVFLTRAVDDSNYPVFTRDRMQVRANFKSDATDVGNTATSVGAFDSTLIDINRTYANNDPNGYPRNWARVTITLSGLPAAGIPKGRFAFRYMATDAGIFGGTAGTNYPSVVGIDSLAFVHQ